MIVWFYNFRSLKTRVTFFMKKQDEAQNLKKYIVSSFIWEKKNESVKFLKWLHDKSTYASKDTLETTCMLLRCALKKRHIYT